MPYFYIRLGALGEIHRAEATINLSRGRRVIVRTRRGVELAEVMSPSSAATTRPGPTNASPVHTHASRDVDRADQPGVAVQPGIADQPGILADQPRILRETTEQDELLIRRLERHKRMAVENCRRELAKAGCKATLLDVDHLFDGGTLVMHFLGPVDELVESITESIVAKYEAVVRSRHLSKLLNDGCGPGCGDDGEGGCGTGCSNGACAGCVVTATTRWAVARSATTT